MHQCFQSIVLYVFEREIKLPYYILLQSYNTVLSMQLSQHSNLLESVQQGGYQAMGTPADKRLVLSKSLMNLGK